MSQVGEIEYNSIKIIFERYWNDFVVVNRENRISSESAAGIEEFMSFVDRDFITAFREKITAHELQQLKQLYEYAKDGTAFTFLRDKDLGGFWEFEKTLKNNDLSELTFTRTAGDPSNASYVDPSTGLLTFEDTLNTPRYDSGKWGHGLIIEGARENDILNQGLDHSDWVKSNLTVNADTTEITDPAGGNNADKLTATAANGTATLTTALNVGTDDGVFSIWIAAPTGSIEGEIRITDDSDTVTGTTTFTATQTWQRIQVAYKNAGDPSDNWQVVIQVDANTEIIYVFLPNLEVGTDVLFASNTMRNDLSSELMPNQVDRDFSGASAWANFDLDAYDETDDLTITASAEGQYCACPVASAPTTIGDRYKMTFDVANIASSWTIKSFDGTQNIGTVSANGAGQDLTWKATTTGGYRIVADDGASSADFDNFTLQRITSKRNTERARLAPTNIINNLKGTIAFWFKPEIQVFDEHAALVLFEHGDSGGGDTHLTINIDTSGRLVGQMTDTLGSTITALASLTSAFTAGEWAHIAVTYDSTISNGIKCYWDGVLLNTSTNDAFIPKANEEFFNIGTNRAGANPAYGIFDDVLIRKDVLTASQILKIYNMGRGLGEVRNRWANVILNNPEFIERYLRGINRFPFELSMREKIT